MSRKHRRDRRFARLHPRLEPTLRRMARLLADGDRDFADDLEQEGRIAAWQSTDRRRRLASRMQLAETAAFNRMLDHLYACTHREESC